jgi:hypothetical protein
MSDLIERSRNQAVLLARENKRTDPGITKIYWFPDEHEVRLLELEDGIPAALSGEVEPFYFDPSPEDNCPLPLGIAIIRNNEFGRLKLPEKWGAWESAREIL